MERKSFMNMNEEDLSALESHTYEVFKCLLESRPFDRPFAEYKGGIRVSAFTSASTEPKQTIFLIDFPPVFDYGCGNETNPCSVAVKVHNIVGMDICSVLRIIIYKIGQHCLVNPLIDLKVCHGGDEEDRSAYWLRLPPNTHICSY